MAGAFRLNSPGMQNAVVALMLALVGGVSQSITMLGAGGGQASATLMANIANTTLYGIYCVCGFLTGSVVTTIGPKWTLMLGIISYPIFQGALWYFTNTGNLWYPIFAAVLVGFGAALLWTGAGFIAFSYAEEKNKARYLAIQWGSLSFGSTILSLVCMAINFNTDAPSVPRSIYILFITIQCVTLLIVYFGIVDPSKVRRNDGTSLAKYPHTDFWTELKAQGELFRDVKALLLFIPIFASEIAIIIASTCNALYFNLRTRSLNSVLFTIMQMVGAVVMMVLLDNEKIGNRRTRGLIGISVMGTVTTAGWIGLAVWLAKHPLDMSAPPAWDWSDGPFAGFCVVNLILGSNMVIYQICCQWLIASLSNEPHRLARYAGYAKGVLAGGLCVVFGTEAASLAQLKVLGFSLALQFSGLFCLLYVCWKYVETTNYLREDGVVAPLAVEKIMLQDVKGVEVRLNEDTHEPEVVQVGTGEVEEVEKEKRHIHTPSTEA